jgi:hypothetical protein
MLQLRCIRRGGPGLTYLRDEPRIDLTDLANNALQQRQKL